MENNAVQALIVSWFSDKAKIMMHLENLPFLLFSHFVNMPPIFPSIFPIACNYFAHKRNNHNVKLKQNEWAKKKNENINEKNTPRIVNNHIKFFFYSLSSIVFFFALLCRFDQSLSFGKLILSGWVGCVCAWAWAWKTPCNQQVQWCTCTYLHVHVNDLMHGSKSVCIVQACDWPYSY